MPHVVLRLYPNAAGLIDKIMENEADVRALLIDVPGFRSYGLVRTEHGGFSVTACEDKDGTDESSRRAAEWVKTNMPDAVIDAPTIIEGEGVLRFTAEGVPA